MSYYPTRRSSSPVTTLLFFISFFTGLSMASPTSPQNITKPTKHYELTSKTTVYAPTDLFNASVRMIYHLGPVLSAPIKVHIIWYGSWARANKHIIREFINSLTASNIPSPSVADWWKPLQTYTDLAGLNVTRWITLGGQKTDRLLSQGHSLTRLSMQSVIKAAITARTNPLPADNNGVYLVLTAEDIVVQDFCSTACGFHSFTFPSIVGYTLPYAWIGNSQKLCPGFCAFPFAVENYARGALQPLKSPNGVVGVDGMISVIAHELAELATNPLGNGWYAGDNPISPNEVGDLCLAHYGMGAGAGYIGEVLHDANGAVYNVKGVRRRFLVQWVYIKVADGCVGPNM